MKRYLAFSEDILCMANLRGRQIVNPSGLPFSFYFSTKTKHGIRVKPVFNPNQLNQSEVGNLELHGNWNYTPGPNEKHISTKNKAIMLKFFRDNKVLFAAVWEGELQEDVVQDYFRGFISLDEVLNEFDSDNYLSNYEEFSQIETVAEFEEFVRKYNCFNMND